MPFEIHTEEDIAGLEARARATNGVGPHVLSFAEILKADVCEPAMLVDQIMPATGASLIVGAAKSGKTLVAVAQAISVASGAALFGHYRVLKPGPVLFVERDDPGGLARPPQSIPMKPSSSASVFTIPFASTSSAQRNTDTRC